MILTWTNFTGEFPRTAPHLLPENAAQVAQDCDFTDGRLRPLAQPSEVFPMNGGPVRGLFTDDGLRFLTWTEPTRAYLSQTVDDNFERIYFTNSQGLRVTQRRFMTTHGGPPAQSWKVGVPAPSAAPVVAAVDRATWPTDAGANLSFKFFFERAGQKVDEAVFNPTVVTKWRKYQMALASIGVDGGGGGGTVNDGYDVTITGYAYRKSITVGDGDLVWTEVEVSLAATHITLVDADTISGIPTIPTNWLPVSNPSFSRVLVGGSWIAVDTLYYAKAGGRLASVINGSTQVTQTQVQANVDTSLACVEVSLVGSDGKTKWTAYSKNSAFANSVSAFPGGVEVVVSLIDGTLTVELVWGVADTRAYVATAVNQWLEESAPSPPTLIDLHYIQQAQCAAAYTLAAGYYPLKGMTFYRTSQGSNDYFAVSADFVQPGVTLTDTSAPAGDAPSTAIVLKSFNWTPPPEGARNLVALPNGIFAVSDGRDIWFCEPYRPHTFPYSMTLPYAVVGLCAADSGMVVTTTAYPYWVSGQHSAGMSSTKIQAVQAGISNDAMCQVGDGVVYASNDGLVFVRGLQASLAESQVFWSRREWRSRYRARLKQLKLFAHDGYVCGLFDLPYGFFVRLDEGGSLTHIDVGGHGAFLLPQTDVVYVGTDSGITEFAGIEGAHPFVWQSKKKVLARPQNFGAAHVVVDGAVNVAVIGDGRVLGEAACDGDTYFRISADDACLEWSIVIDGTGEVERVTLAGSFQEMRNA